MDVSDIEAVLSRMDSVLPKNLMAKAGIEIACQDARAKALGVSVSHLLGGTLKNPVEVIEVVDIVSPEEAAQMALQRVAEGFQFEDQDRLIPGRRPNGLERLCSVDRRSNSCRRNQGSDRATAKSL
jgi:hypothetical protein